MAKPVKLDKTNLAIVQNLWNGRKSYAEIAETLGITTATVRSRVNSMLEAQLLQVIGLVDPEAFEGHISAVITMQVELGRMASIVDQIGAMKPVVACAALTGSINVIAICMFNQDFTHADFLFGDLAGVEGIESVETHFVARAVNWQLRYVL